MLINKAKAIDPKLKPKNNVLTKEVPSKLKKTLNENLKKPLSKLLESNANTRSNIQPLNNNLANGLKPTVKSTPVNNIRHAEHEDKVLKNETVFRSSDTFKKTFNKDRDEVGITKQIVHKKELSGQQQATILTSNNTLATGPSEKNINSKIVTLTSQVSPQKMLRQISSITNNNLTTNYTEVAKDGLTIKTNTIEQSGEFVNTLQSPTNNYKSLTNNLKTISSKITPKAGHQILFNSNLVLSGANNNQVSPTQINPFDKPLKIVQYNEEKNNLDLENLNILNSIQQFNMILKNTNIGGNGVLSEENLRRIQELNEILKALTLEARELNSHQSSIKADKTDEKKQSSNIPIVTAQSLSSSLKPIKHAKAQLSTQNSNAAKKNAKNFANTIKTPLSPKMPQIDIRQSKDLEDSNFSEHKLNSAAKKDLITSDIYKNSDVRIKRYGVLFEFITTNISDIKTMIIASITRRPEGGSGEDNDDLIRMNILNQHEGHMKKKSSTSGEIEKMALKINEENSLLLSSLLNSTLKKQKDFSGEKMINISSNKEKFNPPENCDEWDIDEDVSEKVIYTNLKQNKRNDEFQESKHNSRRRNKNRNREGFNVSKSFIISSINSDFYMDLMDQTYKGVSNSISLEMSELQVDQLKEPINQSRIVERKEEESLDKTRENINLFDKKAVNMPHNVLRSLDFQTRIKMPALKPKLASGHNVPKIEIEKIHSNQMTYKEKEKDKDKEDNRTVKKSVDNDKQNSEGKKDSGCVIF